MSQCSPSKFSQAPSILEALDDEGKPARGAAVQAARAKPDREACESGLQKSLESKLSSAAHQPEGLAESFDPRIQAEKEALSPRTPLPHHPPLHPCRCKVAARSSRPSALLVKPKLPNEKRICFPLHFMALNGLWQCYPTAQISRSRQLRGAQRRRQGPEDPP